MGICVQKSLVSFQAPKPSRSSSRQSFLYNSFTYDPTYAEQQSNFFIFDVPYFCQIQYILRKEQLQKQITPFIKKQKQKQKIGEKNNLQSFGNIEQHIEEIQKAIAKFKSSNFFEGVKQMQKKSLIQSQSNMEVEKHEKVIHRLESRQLEQKEKFELNNILNFEMVSVTLNLNQYEEVDFLSFDVFVKDINVLTVGGNVIDNKWKPVGVNQISVTNVKINFENDTGEQNVYIKILSKLQGDEIIQCTIPFNRMTFKYDIPVLQTCNIRNRQDKEPLGQLHFKVQYIQDFQDHKYRVIKYLKDREQALKSILEKAREHNMEALHDKTIVLQGDNESYVSQLHRQHKQPK